CSRAPRDLRPFPTRRSSDLPHKHLDASRTIQDSVAVGKATHKLRVGVNGPLELYDYPGGYAQRFDGIDKSGGERPAELRKVYQKSEEHPPQLPPLTHLLCRL